MPVGIADFCGGQAKNAIPAQAEATIMIPAEKERQVRELLGTYEKDFVTAFGDIETGYTLTITSEKPVFTRMRLTSNSNAFPGPMIKSPLNSI